MNWIDKLEKKFGRFAIQNLMMYVTILYVIGFVLDLVSPEFYSLYLSLDMSAIFQGQIWRLVTFLLQPPSSSAIFMIFALMLYYMIGTQLEAQWGAFRFNLYFFMGVFCHIIAALVTFIVTGISFQLGTSYLNLSLFFAYAALFPDVQFFLFGVLPIKVKYLAWVDAAYFGYAILQAFLPGYGGNPIYGVIYQGRAIAAFVSVLNFLIFYVSSRKVRKYAPKEIQRRRRYQKEVQAGKKESVYANGAKHRCTVCGRTELDDETLEFRYCSRCNGNYEYCQDHLFTHEHVK